MKSFPRFLLGLTIVLLTASAQAHHSFAMFDQAKVWTWVGTVQEYKWQNPHMHITVEVAAGAKNPETVGLWDFEGESITISGRQGWTRKSFAAGDAITIVGHPAKDGQKGAMIKYAVTADGTVLYHSLDRNITPENTPK